MSVGQLAALARRHVLAVCLIWLVTAGIAIDFRYTPPIYQETATVALEPENFISVEPLSVNQSFLENNSLITTCLLLAMRLSGPQGEAQLHRAGVTGNFAVSVVNDSNADTPSYPYPDLLVSVADRNPDTTHQQWIEAGQVIAANIAAIQANNHFPTRDLIATYTLSDSGPIPQRGSLVRTYAALMFLACVATFCMCRFLDLHSKNSVKVGMTGYSQSGQTILSA